MYEQVPIDAIRVLSHDVALMFEFFENVGMKADLSTLRARYPQIGWDPIRGLGDVVPLGQSHPSVVS